MSDELVTIATFSRPMEAHLTRMRLESEGIECFIGDEYTVAANWLFSNAVGGVKLKVRESDAQEAAEILQQEPADIDSIEMDEDMETPENIAIDKDEPVCPKCDSSDVYYEEYSRRAVFASWLLLGIPLPFLKRKWSCKGCSYEWKD